jgi:hypothetical protein
MSGYLKTNTDAAFSKSSKDGATSSNIMNYQVDFCAAQAIWYERGYDVCALEVMACRDGLKLVVQLGLQRVELETDCLQLV